MTTRPIQPLAAELKDLAALAKRPFVNPVRAALKERGMSQVEFARSLEPVLFSNTICQWARWVPGPTSGRLPPESYWPQLAKLLGIPVDTWGPLHRLGVLAKMMTAKEAGAALKKPEPIPWNEKRAKKPPVKTKPAKRRVRRNHVALLEAKQAEAAVKEEPRVVLDGDAA